MSEFKVTVKRIVLVMATDLADAISHVAAQVPDDSATVKITAKLQRGDDES